MGKKGARQFGLSRCIMHWNEKMRKKKLSRRKSRKSGRGSPRQTANLVKKTV